MGMVYALICEETMETYTNVYERIQEIRPLISLITTKRIVGEEKGDHDTNNEIKKIWSQIYNELKLIRNNREKSISERDAHTLMRILFEAQRCDWLWDIFSIKTGTHIRTTDGVIYEAERILNIFQIDTLQLNLVRCIIRLAKTITKGNDVSHFSYKHICIGGKTEPVFRVSLRGEENDNISLTKALEDLKDFYYYTKYNQFDELEIIFTPRKGWFVSQFRLMLAK